jgi:hypothetical protein
MGGVGCFEGLPVLGARVFDLRDKGLLLPADKVLLGLGVLGELCVTGAKGVDLGSVIGAKGIELGDMFRLCGCGLRFEIGAGGVGLAGVLVAEILKGEFVLAMGGGQLCFVLLTESFGLSGVICAGLLEGGFVLGEGEDERRIEGFLFAPGV